MKALSMNDTTTEEVQFPDTVFLAEPERSDYSAHMGEFEYIPPKGLEPNWFHRKMQYLVLGISWRKR